MRRLQKVQKLDWLITILHPRLGRKRRLQKAPDWKLQHPATDGVTAWAGDGRWSKMRRLRSVCLASEQSPIHREQH